MDYWNLATARGVLINSAILFSLLITACDLEDSRLMATLPGEWSSTDVSDERETATFENDEIRWNNKVQGEYRCPYRVRSFDEKARTVDINTICRKRSGTDQPVDYRLEFSEDYRSFKLTLEGRVTGVFRSR